MRTLRWIAVGLVVGATLALPVEASADGGAFIDFGGTYYTPGGGGNGTASGKAFVSVPRDEQGIFERGPFFAYLLPYGESLREGRPIPDGAIRLGTFSIEHLERSTFVMRVAFSIPDVATGMYDVQVCNDPCTIAGFREPLSGLITIARTAAEAKLIRQVDGLRWETVWLRSRVDKLKGSNEELEAALTEAVAELDALEVRLADLQASSTPSPIVTAPSESTDRPLVEAWALVAIVVALLVALVSVALGLIFSRRHAATLVVPNTIAELDAETPALDPEVRELARH